VETLKLYVPLAAPPTPRFPVKAPVLEKLAAPVTPSVLESVAAPLMVDGPLIRTEPVPFGVMFKLIFVSEPAGLNTGPFPVAAPVKLT